MNPPIIASVILALAFLGSGYILSNKQVTTINTPAMNGTLATTGEGRVSVSPDMVVLSLSVYNRAISSKDAYNTTNAGVNALKTLLKEAGVVDIDMQTTGVYLNPEYNYVDGNQKPNGFSATHALSVKIRKMADANTILDKVAEIVGVQIQSVSYDLDKKDIVYSEARKLAIEKARIKADEMAKVADVKIKKVQSISESGNENSPVPYQNAKVMMADAGTSPTSLSAGQLEYTIHVAVTYELE